jgi:excisionase family DNA binding protein
MMALITTNEAAKKLGVHISRIHQFIKGNRLPAQRYGRDYLIDERHLAPLKGLKTGRPKKSAKKSKKGSAK